METWAQSRESLHRPRWSTNRSRVLRCINLYDFGGLAHPEDQVFLDSISKPKWAARVGLSQLGMKNASGSVAERCAKTFSSEGAWTSAMYTVVSDPYAIAVDALDSPSDILFPECLGVEKAEGCSRLFVIGAHPIRRRSSIVEGPMESNR